MMRYQHLEWQVRSISTQEAVCSPSIEQSGERDVRQMKKKDEKFVFTFHFHVAVRNDNNKRTLK